MASKGVTLLLLVSMGFSAILWSAPKKKKGETEEVTQSLEVLQDPPAAVATDAALLSFHVSALSAKGLLSQQIRDALKNIFSQTKGGRIVRLRAFVAGSGDMRRFPSLVSEIFTDKKMQLPVVTVVQVGGLPLVGAQVQIEGTVAAKKPVNPGGLAFLNTQGGPAAETGRRLTDALAKLQLEPPSVRQLTCYVNSLESESGLRTQLSTAFPGAPLTIVQLRRDSGGDFAECESVASLKQSPSASPAGEAAESGNRTVVVGPGKLALTGNQMAFGREDKDMKLALDRLGKALESVGASWKSVAATNTYLTTGTIRESFGKARAALTNPELRPAGTALVFEGLPSLDATLSMDAVAVVR